MVKRSQTGLRRGSSRAFAYGPASRSPPSVGRTAGPGDHDPAAHPEVDAQHRARRRAIDRPPDVSHHIVLPCRWTAVSVRPRRAAAISPGACGRQTQVSVSSTSTMRRPSAALLDGGSGALDLGKLRHQPKAGIVRWARSWSAGAGTRPVPIKITSWSDSGDGNCPPASSCDGGPGEVEGRAGGSVDDQLRTEIEVVDGELDGPGGEEVAGGDHVTLELRAVGDESSSVGGAHRECFRSRSAAGCRRTVAGGPTSAAAHSGRGRCRWPRRWTGRCLRPVGGGVDGRGGVGGGHDARAASPATRGGRGSRRRRRSSHGTGRPPAADDHRDRPPGRGAGRARRRRRHGPCEVDAHRPSLARDLRRAARRLRRTGRA